MQPTSFEELHKLCSSPGYIYVLLTLHFRDHILKTNHEGSLNESSFEPINVNELALLARLLMKNNISLQVPSNEQIVEMMYQTDNLLKQLHGDISADGFAAINLQSDYISAFSTGSVLKELFYYGDDSAYDFQFLTIAEKKYANDSVWLKKNYGFSIAEAIQLAHTVAKLQKNNIERLQKKLQSSPQDLLSIYVLSLQEIANEMHENEEKIICILDAFSYKGQNTQFENWSDFNEFKAYPIIPLVDKKYIFLSFYMLAEAIFETPAYWMLNDNNYIVSAGDNKGAFVENFVYEKFYSILGEQYVFKNVKIQKGKNSVDEIDVLVLFGSQALIIQCKNKKLTLSARAGNTELIIDDFQKAVQKAYDQGYSCAQNIQNTELQFIDEKGQLITISKTFSEIFLLSITGSNYPNLTFQAQQLLKYSKDSNSNIKMPLVWDIFTFDTITDFLDTPLQFFYFINKRPSYFEKITAGHELTIFNLHLTSNLEISDDSSSTYLDNSVCDSLNVAVRARYCNLPGPKIPEGILTKIKQPTLLHLIDFINKNPHSSLINFAFILLQIENSLLDEIDQKIINCSNLVLTSTPENGFSLAFPQKSTLIIFQINRYSDHEARAKLLNAFDNPKFQELKKRIGISLDPTSKLPRFAFEKTYLVAKQNALRVGRNDLCPCGSGTKYKKCCLKNHLN